MGLPRLGRRGGDFGDDGPTTVQEVAEKSVWDAVRAVVKRHYHEHTEHCYGPWEACGEHHRHHPDWCGGRQLRCGKKESSPEINQLAAALADAGWNTHKS